MNIINPYKIEALSSIKALVFDWDGVFHSGYKTIDNQSFFSEADSMGINMLRLGYYLKDGLIPKTIIISGENNKTAHFLATREHFDAVFSKAKDKKFILDFLQSEYSIKASEVLFVFDDILDFSLAKLCEIRFLVKRGASHTLEDYVIENKLSDFITQFDGSQHAIREISEFILSKLNYFDKTLETRISNGPEYAGYLEKRREIETKLIEVT